MSWDRIDNFHVYSSTAEATAVSSAVPRDSNTAEVIADSLAVPRDSITAEIVAVSSVSNDSSSASDSSR